MTDYATVIPRPPLSVEDPDVLAITSRDIAATLAVGGYGTCVMCHRMSYSWWDLSRCGLEPVLDARGTLTDQVCLDGDCVGALIGFWVSIITGEPGVDEPRTGVRGGALPGDDGIDRGDSGARLTADERYRSEAERDALMGGMYA